MNNIPVLTTGPIEVLSIAPKLRRQSDDQSEIGSLRAEIAALKGEQIAQPQAVDRDGVPVWLVEVLFEAAGMTTIERVAVSALAQPQIGRGDRVEFDELTARPWAMGDGRGGVRSGVSLSARSVRKLGALKPSSNGHKSAEPVPA